MTLCCIRHCIQIYMQYLCVSLHGQVMHITLGKHHAHHMRVHSLTLHTEQRCKEVPGCLPTLIEPAKAMVEYDKDMKAAAKDTPERALKLGVCTTGACQSG